MNPLAILGHAKPARDALPEVVRENQDIGGVRVIRLQGSVGKDSGSRAKVVDEQAARAEGVFSRPLLFDFNGTTGWDFSTVSYLVLALRRRMAAHAPVGIVNAPAPLIAEMEIGRVDALFRIFASEEQAIAELTRIASGAAPPSHRRSPPVDYPPSMSRPVSRRSREENGIVPTIYPASPRGARHITSPDRPHSRAQPRGLWGEPRGPTC
jgi:hypothetical protein